MDKKLKNLAKKIVDVTHRTPKKETYAYDTQATITRIEGDTAWVHIPGGIVETPVKLTIQASINDKVMVRLSDGDAWITGNNSAPPTDDKLAKDVNKKVDSLMEELRADISRFLNWMLGSSVEFITARVKVAGPKANTPGYRASVTDGVGDVSLMVGTGGINHGVWSDTQNRWLVYGNSDSVFIDGRKFDLATNNITDTWVPVLSSVDGVNCFQHRVIPSNTNSACTKYGNIWTSGNLTLYRRGNIVQCTGSPVLSAVSSRTQFATIPEGYRPVGTAYVRDNGDKTYFLFNAQGMVQTGGSLTAGTYYFSATWATG